MEIALFIGLWPVMSIFVHRRQQTARFCQVLTCEPEGLKEKAPSEEVTLLGWGFSDL
jgi:hypothetical protein